MKLVDDWKRIIQRAYSVRLIIIAGLFSGLEFILPFLPDLFPIPRGAFAVLSFFATAGAFIMRLVAQQNMKEDDAT